jgi:hypothetical protein
MLTSQIGRRRKKRDHFPLVVEGVKRLAWTEEVLRAKCKGDPSKVALARERYLWD